MMMRAVPTTPAAGCVPAGRSAFLPREEDTPKAGASGRKALTPTGLEGEVDGRVNPYGLPWCAMNANSDSVQAACCSTRQGMMDWLALAAAAVVLTLFRLHAFDLPLEADECNYAYIGARLLSGDSMYLDLWDHQPYGVFVLFAGVIALFGDAPEVFRWTAAAFSLVSLLLVFAVVRSVAGRGAATSAAILFAIASSDPGTAGEGCNREIYMATLILTAWYFAVRRPRVSKGDAFLAGCALALASAIKTIVAVHWFFLAAWIAATGALGPRRAQSEPSCKQPEPGDGNSEAEDRSSLFALSTWGDRPLTSTLKALALFAIGPLILWGGSLAYFGATGRFNEFVDAVFLFNLSYSGASEAFLARFGHFFAPQRHPFIFDSALPLWLGGVAASALLAVEAAVRSGGRPGATPRGGRRREATALFLLVLSTYITVCLPARFWPHYYYLLIPVLSIAVPAAFGLLLARVSDFVGLGAASRRTLKATVLGLVPLLLLATEYRDYLGQPPFGITVKRYNSRDFWGRAQGENVRRVTDPNDTVFVFGNDPEIYYYARRRCASRYTMITGLHSGYSGAQGRRETLMAELREHPPRLIIVLFDEPPFDDWVAFVHEYYGDPIGWDLHDRSRREIMFVFARKDQPIESMNWDWDRSEVGGWMLGEKR